ncbi:MAG: hypothetical protein P1U87_10050 [Verrucomicrobiales bacterium]|nr:hypothetical protein [Verrucomicrobiales bacterium]
MKRSPFALACSIGLAVAFLTPSLQAGLRDDIIRLTHRLEESTTTLKREFDVHYRGTYQYRALSGCIRNLQSKARHIHGLAHGSPAAARELRQDVRSMDTSVHQIHSYLDQAEKGGKRKTGNTSHVHNELNKITRTLQSLEALATEKVQRQNRRPPAQFPIPVPNPLTHNSAPLHPHYGSGNRNVGNLFFPNQSSNYSQYGSQSQPQRSSGYSSQSYTNRSVTTSNRFGRTTSHHGYSSSQQPIYRNDPARQILESIFRGLQPR